MRKFVDLTSGDGESCRTILVVHSKVVNSQGDVTRVTNLLLIQRSSHIDRHQ